MTKEQAIESLANLSTETFFGCLVKLKNGEKDSQTVMLSEDLNVFFGQIVDYKTALNQELQPKVKEIINKKVLFGVEPDFFDKVKSKFLKGTLPFNMVVGAVLHIEQITGSAKLPERKEIEFENGLMYIGEVLNGRPKGHGIISFPNGNKIEGEFNGINCKGVYTSALGEYTGEIVKLEPKGQGVLVMTKGGKVEGEFIDSFSWNGKFEMPDGTKYIGEIVDGQRSGNGIMIGEVGSYEGEWENDQQNGFGTLIWNNGNKYVGDFKNNKRHGRGVMQLSNGTAYDGEFAENEMHGWGVFTTPDVIYEGDFRHNKRHGKGVETLSNGEVYDGMFYDDIEFYNDKIGRVFLAEIEIGVYLENERKLISRLEEIANEARIVDERRQRELKMQRELHGIYESMNQRFNSAFSECGVSFSIEDRQRVQYPCRSCGTNMYQFHKRRTGALLGDIAAVALLNVYTWGRNYHHYLYVCPKCGWWVLNPQN